MIVWAKTALHLESPSSLYLYICVHLLQISDQTLDQIAPAATGHVRRRRIAPLYREVDAQWLSESRPAHKSVRLGLSTILALHYKSCHTAVYHYGP